MNARDLQDAVQKLAGTYKKRFAEIFIGTVESVDENKRQCEVISASGVKYTADLSAQGNDGLILIPTLNSPVICGIASVGNGAFVIAFGDLDKVILYIDANNKLEFSATGFLLNGIEVNVTIDGSNKFEFSSTGFAFNGGTFDGMVKVNDLVTKLNNLEALVNTISAAFDAHTHTTACGAGPGVTFVPLAPVAITLTPTVKADIENPKVKH